MPFHLKKLAKMRAAGNSGCGVSMAFRLKQLVKMRAVNGSSGGGSGGGSFEKYSWEGVLASIDAGTYATDYAIGDTVPLDLGNEGVINMQIAAFDTDDLADGSGKAPITWIAKELLATKHRMNPVLAGTPKVAWSDSINNSDELELLAHAQVSHLEIAEISLTITAKKDITSVLSGYVGSGGNFLSVWLDNEPLVENHSSTADFTHTLDFKVGVARVLRATFLPSKVNAQGVVLLTNASSFHISVNQVNTVHSLPYAVGTGVIGGWKECEMREYLANTIMPLIPTKVRGSIKQVAKDADGADAKPKYYTEIVPNYLWIPNYNEVKGANCTYDKLFSDNASRVKKIYSETQNGVAAAWFLRNLYSTQTDPTRINNYDGYDASGANKALPASEQHGILLCFCT